jgi:hypothetical protein
MLSSDPDPSEAASPSMVRPPTNDGGGGPATPAEDSSQVAAPVEQERPSAKTTRHKRQPKPSQIVLIVPEKIVHELRQVGESNSSLKVLQLPSDRIAVDVHKTPGDGKDKAREWLKDLGPTVTGLFSLIIALAAAYYAYQINSRQNEIKENENQAAAANLRAEVFKELNEKDSAKRTLAVIRLAEYGKTVLDAVKMALGVEQDTIREGAADVMQQIFLSGRVKPEEFFPVLRGYFDTRNMTLRRGVLECYVKIGKRLPEDESRIVIGLLKKLDLGADCSHSEDENLFLEIPIFLDYWPSGDSRDLLLAIAGNTSCLRPRLKAVENLPKVAKILPLQERNDIKAAIIRLALPDTPDSLKQSINIAIKQIEAIPSP